MSGNPRYALLSSAEGFSVFELTRRSAIVTALSASLIAGRAHAAAQAGDHAMTNDSELEQHRHDWDWLVGNWRVRHHRLKERLTGSTEWQEFDGTCVMTPTLNGFGNMDDNWLDLPGGAYRAMGIRAFQS